jgi:hypothetical protein
MKTKEQLKDKPKQISETSKPVIQKEINEINGKIFSLKTKIIIIFLIGIIIGLTVAVVMLTVTHKNQKKSIKWKYQILS